jgi:F0F1-type ATP synthase assembly protein I
MTLKWMFMALVALACFWSFDSAIQSDFKPLRKHRIILFISGFLNGISIVWLMDSNSSWSDFWLYLFIGTLLGYGWSFTAPRRWQETQEQIRKKQERTHKER